MPELTKVWSKFAVTSKDGTVLKLRIMDMSAVHSVQEKVLDVIINYFVREEVNFIAAKVPQNAKAMKEITEFQRKALKMKEQHIVICCLDNEDNQIDEVIGTSIVGFLSKGDPIPKLDFKTQEAEKLMEILGGLSEIYDEMKIFDLDPCLVCRGIVVRPEYRGLGIAQEFLKVRRLMCKEYGIPINGAWMTSYGTQKAAERDGWETVCELQYEDLGKKFNVTYERLPPSIKFMIAKIQL